MRRVLIVGAGQAGLQLALGLQSHGYDVTVLTDRSAEEVRAGKVLSSQCMFDSALRTERELGLDLWAEEAPRIEGVGLSVTGPDAARVIDWVGRLDAYAQSVDQRLKMSTWLETFAGRGGRVELRKVTAADVEHLAGSYDLVLVASGKGALGSLFERDHAHSPHDRPQRALAAAYVHGLGPRPEHDFPAVRCNAVPGIGELFVVPALTVSGPCDILLWEAVPGGPADAFDGLRDPAEHLRVTLELMKTFTPWEYDRARAGVELTDAGATLAGRFTPVVRRPVGELPGGVAVLGVADVVVTNDPITGQGANNAAKCAAVYLAAILAHGDKPFDRDFQQAAFDTFWEIAGPVTTWSNAMLAPPPPHVLDLFVAGSRYQAVADRFANNFNDPADVDRWYLDPAKAAAYLASVASEN
ncbi:2-polyprenyl-6-methoxyphenol hydroxylase-like FAD-dependent oxidoreductase [Streptomyces sp. 1114.5]|uniref:styrene monooxygenase/indole monooxygenase family protein n=1 Tax=unclassified Streptomyces TaxID=2593676 RepID=UPI000BD6730B|nr:MULTISPECIES: styrene monooxygenase/indole monooxygenase family protein [unclassified Streptomyces]RKT20118.1 2-polyprenyl-6-methoxyphenol hydroxylase-like FAD-dependent oxidoreductase [Streptomyces sp. 1114.5]SOB86307.1 2-polyprenyl-6-methoxyphenol hydroxylase [Streptomyces sp. 1331.2]